MATGATASITFVPTNTVLATADVVATIFPQPAIWYPQPPSFPNANAQNFCINLPNPKSDYLKKQWYDQGFAPTMVQGEGFVQCYCVGAYLSPGCEKMPAGGITSAHVLTNQVLNNEPYIQITGTMDCGVLNINCVGSYFGVFDDGGQYDSVGFQNCGKEPYSGVDAAKHPTMPQYVEQAGDGIFCMRICAGGQGEHDPCNVKNDTAGCYDTMGFVNTPGFSTDGVAINVNLPPPSNNTLGNYLGPYMQITMTTTTTTSAAATATGAVTNPASGGATPAPGGSVASVSATGATTKSGAGRTVLGGGAGFIFVIAATLLF
ncbi:hypothetical protein HK101_007059 [Irineochytrium annulatum]|nr:hypothetical protein HK101_007059 [Irineochytrium annulatum]